jgi:hypothetical protein
MLTLTHSPRLLRLTALLLVAGLLTACDSTDDNEPPDEPLEVQRIEDVPADPSTGRDPTTGEAIDTDRYTFVSLRTGQVVLRYDTDARADSNSTAWDLGFQGTNVIVNGGTSGPGNGAALIVEELFEDVTEAPADDELRVDGSASCDDGSSFAVCPGSDNGWYNYNFQTNIIAPIPGRTLVVRTADGRYAKVRFVSYYEGAPANPDGFADEARYITFEYVFQEDGSRDLSVPAN